MRSLQRPKAFLSSAVLAALAFFAPGLSAQQTGTVSGEIREAGSLRPLPGVQVFSPGTDRGTLTNAQGRFLMVNVPVGEVTVQAQSVGYASSTQTVTVVAGQTARLDFTLSTSAIALDEVVVTGTGAPAQRRTLGHSLASIDASSLEDRPVINVSQALQGREPGVQALNTGGMTGEGTRIRIRGSASLSQGNAPVIYLDGVRVDAGGAGRTSRLDDLNPDAIDRIEILKGAAAATLYGTEASNGVIQIFTKRGQSGPTQWNYAYEGGFSKYPEERWAPHAAFARTQAEADRLVQHWGLPSGLKAYDVFEVDWIPTLFETGRHNIHSLSVAGGGQNITYFVSGRTSGENGPFGGEIFRTPGFDLAEDVEKARQANFNLTMFPVEKLRLRTSGMYVERYNSAPGIGNSTAAPYSMAMMAQPWRANENNLGGTSAFQTVREGMQRLDWREVQRFGGSFGANFKPVETVTLDATFGVDVVNQQTFGLVPFGYNVDNFTGTSIFGQKSLSDRNRRDLSLDVNGNWAESFGDFTSSLVVGSQLLLEKTQTTGGTGTDFPAPGLTVAGAAGQRTVSDSYSAQASVGVFVQEMIGFRDYLFLTLGARYDRHSAFGETAGGQIYPKASLSMVASDSPWWKQNDLVSSLQLRAAVGTSGLQPSAFDKFTTFSANRSIYGPGVQPSSVGNPDLKPEISTEWETGATVGLFSNRAALDVTYWNRTVNDLMINRTFVPSGGFLSSQRDNIGSMNAQGLELGLKGTAIQTPTFSMSPYVNAAWTREEITDMGDSPPLKVAGTVRYLNWHRVGYAPSAFFGPTLMDTEYPITLAGNCTPATREQLLAHFASVRTPQSIAILLNGCGTPAAKNDYLGKSTPDWAGSFGADFSFFQNFSAGAQFEFKFGNYKVHNLMDAFRRSHPSLGRNIRSSAEIESTLSNPASTAEQRLAAAMRWVNGVAALSPYDGLNEVEDGDLLRFREAFVSYNAPASFAERIRMNSVSFSVSARNLALWTKYSGLDPENNVEGGGADGSFTESVDSWGLALPRRLNFAIRLGF